MPVRGRIFLALLFAFALVTQSASSGVYQDGIRPLVVAQPGRLTEYAEYDDADDNLLLLSAIIAPATPLLERLTQVAFVQNLHQTVHSDRASVPLYELHAIWRI